MSDTTIEAETTGKPLSTEPEASREDDGCSTPDAHDRADRSASGFQSTEDTAEGGQEMSISNENGNIQAKGEELMPTDTKQVAGTRKVKIKPCASGDYYPRPIEGFSVPGPAASKEEIPEEEVTEVEIPEEEIPEEEVTEVEISEEEMAFYSHWHFIWEVKQHWPDRFFEYHISYDHYLHGMTCSPRSWAKLDTGDIQDGNEHTEVTCSWYQEITEGMKKYDVSVRVEVPSGIQIQHRNFWGLDADHAEEYAEQWLRWRIKKGWKVKKSEILHVREVK